MSVDRIIRLNELLRREISEAIYRYVTEDRYDLSAITVSRVVMSKNLQHARVMISIRGHENERAGMLNILERHRAEIQSKINIDLHLKYTPKLIFQIDHSIEKGDKILAILSDMEKEGNKRTEEIKDISKDDAKATNENDG